MDQYLSSLYLMISEGNTNPNPSVDVAGQEPSTLINLYGWLPILLCFAGYGSLLMHSNIRVGVARPETDSTTCVGC